MGKKTESVVTGILNSISEETINRNVDKLIAATKEISENQMKFKEKELNYKKELDDKKLRAQQEAGKEYRDMVAEEFKRICGIMSKTDPTTDKYEKLSDRLNDLKKLLKINWTSGFDYD